MFHAPGLCAKVTHFFELRLSNIERDNRSFYELLVRETGPPAYVLRARLVGELRMCLG